MTDKEDTACLDLKQIEEMFKEPKKWTVVFDSSEHGVISLVDVAKLVRKGILF